MPGRPRAARDRRGRGLRSALVPPEVPLARTRAEDFDELVLDAVEHFSERWAAELADLEVAVEDVPPEPSAGSAAEQGVPLARLDRLERRGAAARGARLTVYRRPVEARALDAIDLADLVHDVVLDQVADLLGLDPDVVDPPE
ncbi:MAG: metallopeptidase family protein [Mycobacteriales bacterium]|nr:metallopeptidase family protein [Frankia sp.]